jgi:hypothetical protein
MHLVHQWRKLSILSSISPAAPLLTLVDICQLSLVYFVFSILFSPVLPTLSYPNPALLELAGAGLICFINE